MLATAVFHELPVTVPVSFHDRPVRQFGAGSITESPVGPCVWGGPQSRVGFDLDHELPPSLRIRVIHRVIRSHSNGPFGSNI